MRKLHAYSYMLDRAADFCARSIQLQSIPRSSSPSQVPATKKAHEFLGIVLDSMAVDRDDKVIARSVLCVACFLLRHCIHYATACLRLSWLEPPNLERIGATVPGYLATWLPAAGQEGKVSHSRARAALCRSALT